MGGVGVGLLAVWFERCGEAVEKVAGDGIALARDLFQSFAIQDAEFTSVVVDKTAAAEGTGREGDGRATRADHLGEELLGELKLWGADAIGDHEKPACGAFLDVVEAIAGGDLPQKQGGVLNVLENDPENGLLHEELLLKALEVDAEGGSGNLDEAVVRAVRGTEEKERFRDAFAADEGDFNAIAGRHGGNDGGGS